MQKAAIELGGRALRRAFRLTQSGKRMLRLTACAGLVKHSVQAVWGVSAGKSQFDAKTSTILKQ
ncbi:hypothetical protein GCM10022405_12770 [Gibbsiella dentisursi]|uniref:Transposase n=1 Tax=Gibbsiella dentisursi TaxID=796890 RepID=A0ABP7KUZ9_9GAMM